MANYNILDEVKEKLRPDPRWLDVFEEARRMLAQRVPKHIKVLPGGSMAKGTHTKDKREGDLFMVFPTYYSLAEITMLAFRYARQTFSHYQIRYANHPYLTVEYKGLSIDIVPIYKWTGKPITPMDRTPLHTQYINEHITDSQRDDVRLLKAFLKTIGVYGAEIRVEGFSGYLCELLILWAGSFLDLLRRAAEWKPPIVVEMEHPWKKDITGHLVVVDPVDPNRNVATVVSRTSLWRFVVAARLFLEHPHKAFFHPPKLPLPPNDIFEQRRTFGIGIIMDRLPIADDILWGKLKKEGYKMMRALQQRGFRMVGNYFWADDENILVFYELEGRFLTHVHKVKGPPVHNKEASRRFMVKHPQVHVEHDYLVAIKERKVIDAEAFLKSHLEDWEDIGTAPKLLKGRWLIHQWGHVLSDYFYRNAHYPLNVVENDKRLNGNT